MHSTPYGTSKVMRELARRDRRIAKATRLTMRRAERKAMAERAEPVRDAPRADEMVGMR
jgi:hypothetical protein